LNVIIFEFYVDTK